jgi:RNA polymerase-binding transcription factor DksA
MNRTALALLQGRLWRAAVHFDERLHSVGDVDPAGSPTQVKAHLHDNEEVAIPPIGHLEAEFSAVLRALERIEKGSYGLCENCGRAIDPDRLYARPQQLACGACERSEPLAATALAALRPPTAGETLPAPARLATLRHDRSRQGHGDDARWQGDARQGS